jgi:LCP family protein required for cell wall assembly
MADRPRGNGGPEEGTPEYNWLYGSKGSGASGADATRAVPRQQPGEETRVMPASDAGTSTPPRRTSRPTPPPVSPPPGETARTGRRFRAPKFRWRWLLVLLLAWIVYLVAVPLYAWTQVEKVDFEPGGNRPEDQPGTTYLLVGSDSRAGLSKEERKELGTGNASGQRTDTIMLLHTGDGPNLLMSVPRDSIVEVPGHGTTKINAAYAFGGAKLLVKTLENETGIRIDEYVEIGLGGLAGVVDAVGGIEICPTQNMKDPLANLNIKKGCQEVDGATALGYARSRHTSGIGDIERVKHQREVVAAVGDKVVSPWTFINPVRYWRLSMAVPDFFAFGEGTGPLQAAKWASAMTNVDLSCVVPIADLAVNWDEQRSEQLFGFIKDDATGDIPKALCTPTGLPRGVTG